MNDCIFCKIANKEIPAKIEYEDDDMIAFHDLNPQAPIHLLFIPKKHIESLDKLNQEDSIVIGKIFFQISKLAQSLGLDESGYRVVNNMGADGGQTVYHIHFHLLGKRPLTWPPG
ncbi:MAG: histidine triad nucleotide-binding protein [Leptospira sp.]|nr:histidine triad nucleotide-binding protein [Leptospira sp.]